MERTHFRDDVDPVDDASVDDASIDATPLRALSTRALLNRLASGIIAAALVAWGFVQGVGVGLGALAVYCGITGLIWYADELGSIRWLSRYRIAPARTSAGAWIAAVGWFLLVGLPLVFLLTHL